MSEQGKPEPQPCNHECGIEGIHKTCVCAICGGQWPNDRDAASQPLVPQPQGEKVEPLCWQIKSGRKIYVFKNRPEPQPVYEYGGLKIGDIIMDELEPLVPQQEPTLEPWGPIVQQIHSHKPILGCVKCGAKSEEEATRICTASYDDCPMCNAPDDWTEALIKINIDTIAAGFYGDPDKSGVPSEQGTPPQDVTFADIHDWLLSRFPPDTTFSLTTVAGILAGWASSQGTGWVSVEGLKDLRGYFSHRAVENDRRASTKSDESERRWHFAKHDTYKRCAEKLDEVIRATRALPTPPSGETT